MNSLTIKRITTQITYTHLPKDFHISHGIDQQKRSHVITSITASGNEGEYTGWGEASPLTFFTGETAETIKLLIDAHYQPHLKNQDIRNINPLLDTLEHYYPHNPTALTAIDMALYDLKARIQNENVSEFIGGTTPNIRVYKAVGIGNPSETKEDAKYLLDAGFNAIKIKVGLNWREDIKRTEAVRDIAGDAINLCADANEGYSISDAIRYAKAAASLGVDYIEQPVPAWNIDGLQTVRDQSGLAVMADESLRDIRNAVHLLETKAVDIFGIKLVKSGGLRRALQIIDLAKAYQVPCVIISPFDTVLGATANLSLAATTNTSFAHGIGTSVIASGDTFGQLRFKNGCIEIPKGPGLGFSLNESLAA